MGAMYNVEACKEMDLREFISKHSFFYGGNKEKLKEDYEKIIRPHRKNTKAKRSKRV